MKHRNIRYVLTGFVTLLLGITPACSSLPLPFSSQPQPNSPQANSKQTLTFSRFLAPFLPSSKIPATTGTLSS